MRIGILGGTFDPIHEGHLALARAACREIKLDRVIFVPARQHPLKEKGETIASPKHRLALAMRGIENDPKFEVSDCEIRRSGLSYTVDTLRALRKEYPKPHELFFITGGDWGKSLDQWKDIDTIFSLAQFVVANRPGFDLKRVPHQVQTLEFVPLDISSTEVRSRLKEGNVVSAMIPKSVLEYIQEHGLYQS